jgi:hypothetical protein
MPEHRISGDRRTVLQVVLQHVVVPLVAGAAYSSGVPQTTEHLHRIHNSHSSILRNCYMAFLGRSEPCVSDTKNMNCIGELAVNSKNDHGAFVVSGNFLFETRLVTALREYTECCLMSRNLIDLLREYNADVAIPCTKSQAGTHTAARLRFLISSFMVVKIWIILSEDEMIGRSK